MLHPPVYSPQLHSVHSVFFGGGTPSLAQPEMVSGLLRCVGEQAHLSDDLEVTMEMNPTVGVRVVASVLCVCTYVYVCMYVCVCVCVCGCTGEWGVYR
jgi:hypothetical protein